MVKVLLDRRWKKADYSIGRMYVQDYLLCNTLEDTDRGLTSIMSETVIREKKVAGKTAIPTGTYKLRLSVSPKFKNRKWAKDYGGLTPEIVGVPGFSGVRIHPGTTAADTDGCPIVGKNTEPGKVTSSQACYKELMEKLYTAHLAGEEMTITVQ